MDPRSSTSRMHRGVIGAAVLVLAVPAMAQTLQEVVVSASREAQRSFDVPASVTVVGAGEIAAAGPRVNLSEVMGRVAGISVLDRQNYAQDLQLTIRGAGARSTFGIRGVRLVVDGIPATMPDGQGQASTISLPSTGRIEVLRGPLAQLYGNSAGGVVQAFTADAPSRPELRFGLDAGPEDMRRWGLQLAGRSGALDYLVDHSDFATDGWRDHGAARRRHTNARLRWDVTERTRLTLVANVFDQPWAEDPLGLTREQMQADPRQAVPSATQYQAGKDVSQRQLGLALEHRLDARRDLTVRVYGGQRDLFNRLSTPLSAQMAPTSAGGIVVLDRHYDGLGVRHAHTLSLGEGQVRLSVGLDVERMREHRQGYVNDSGRQGELKRDEDDRVESLGLYAQADWAINEDWSAVAGLRANRVRFRIDDHFVRPDNPDDSGRVRHSATHPVLGLTRHLGDRANVYVNVGRGFETPTLAELAYRTGGSGPNLALAPSRSTHAELGLKAHVAEGQRLDVALFDIRSRDEIVVAAASGGRTIYTNAGRTRRTGMEVTYSAQWTPEWHGYLALSTLNARFVDAFHGGTQFVPAGNRIPGVLNRMLFGELAWRPRAWPGFTAALELVRRGSMVVDDVNSDHVAAVTLWNLRLGWQRSFGAWTVGAQLRVNNVGDKAYVGSVIVNDGNRRFFEPAPGRQWGLGVTASYAF
jgi:iron complex outermembrane receptor protein